MRKSFLVVLFLAFCPMLVAQQALNNDSLIKMVKAGLSEDVIIITINASSGAYDISADGLIALKAAGVSDKVIAAIAMKSSGAAPAPVSPLPSMPANTAAQAGQEPAQQPAVTTPSARMPRVFLTSVSHGNQQNAARDQSMEMSKDFERDCPGIRISINQQMADYTVALNHIEVGFARDNQFQVANKDGDLISKTKEGGSIAGGVKKVCALILEDWAKK